MAWYLAGILLCANIVLCGRINHLEGNLAAEKTEHEAARQERDRFRAQFEQEHLKAQALGDNARACLAREALAQTNARDRAEIMEMAKPRARTEDENVVDDATRSAVIERLNRGLRF